MASRQIAEDPDVMGGAPVFAGTRVPIETVLVATREGFHVREIRQHYPSVTAEQIEAAQIYSQPKLPLDEAVEKERIRLARQLSAKVQTHMALEGQHVREPSLDARRLDRAAVSVSDRQLWKKPK